MESGRKWLITKGREILIATATRAFIISLGIQVIAAQVVANPSKADPIQFYGSFADFLVHLNLKTEVQGGLDPFLVHTSGDRFVRKAFGFQQKEEESMDGFLDRIAKEQNLNLKKLGPYRYFSIAGDNQDGVVAEVLFAKRSDVVGAARTASLKLGPADNGTLPSFAKAIAQSENNRISRFQTVEKSLKKANSLYFIAKNAERGTALVGPDLTLARATYREIEVELSEISRVFRDSIREYVRDRNQVSDVFNKASAYLPNSLVQEAYYRNLANNLSSCSYILDNAKLFNEPAAIADLKDLISHQQILVGKGLAESQKLAKRGEELSARANEFWTKKDYTNAYKQYSILFDAVQDRSAKTRLGCGLLATKFYSSRVQELQKIIAAQKNGSGKVPEMIDAQSLLGLDDSMADVLSKMLKISIKRPSGNRENNPGRLGAIYGLTVNTSSLSGGISTFGIQLFDKGGTSTPAVDKNGSKEAVNPSEDSKGEISLKDAELVKKSPSDFDIKIQAQGDYYLDEYTKASIFDALHYVRGNHFPDLSKKSILILMDESVGVAYGGDSAGAAISIAAMSRALDKPPRANICMTGAVRAYGDVRPVGGLLLKAQAAADRGFGAMLVPDGNLAQLKLIDVESLGSLQLITGKTMDDYIRFAIPLNKDDERRSAEVFRGYALGYLLFKGEDFSRSLTALKSVLAACPNHLSAASLVHLMELAGVEPKPLPTELVAYLPRPF